jgi:hypothetical protein
MVRARLALLALGGSLLLTSGCSTCRQDECTTSHGWFSRFRLASRTTSAPCECEGGMPATGMPMMPGDGPVMMPPSGCATPPSTFPMAPTFPGNPPPPTIITNPPPGMQPPINGQPPRIVPVPQAPQATPMPYSPQ